MFRGVIWHLFWEIAIEFKLSTWVLIRWYIWNGMRMYKRNWKIYALHTTKAKKRSAISCFLCHIQGLNNANYCMSNGSLLIDTIFSPCRKRSCQFTYKPAKIDIIDLWTLFAEGRHQICPFHQCQFFHLQTDLLTHEISWPRFSYVRTHHMFSRILNFCFW